MNPIQYEETAAFKKDLKKLLKRFRSLEEDLQAVRKHAIELLHIHGLNNQSIFPIPNFCNDKVQIYKIKKFACKSIKGKGANSGIRVTYAYRAALAIVEFLEIYFKADQEDADYERLKVYFSRYGEEE